MFTKTLSGIKYHVRTNRQQRKLLSWAELPDKVKTKHFEYVEYSTNSDDIYTPRFFKYREWWYDTYEFESTATTYSSDIKALGFNAYQTDSFWSATVVCYFDSDGYELDGAVIVGRIHW